MAYVLPPRAPVAAAEEAQRPVAAVADPGPDFLAAGAMRAYAPADTTEFEFPDEERKHLVRDVAVFVIVSVFVAYFIVKVFIEKDQEEAPPPTDGKPIPTH